jgi:hypothetical protein
VEIEPDSRPDLSTLNLEIKGEIMDRQSPTSGNYPLDNLTYDLITIIYEKSKALEAYGKYLVDARGDQTITEMIGRMRRQDEDCVEELRQRLADLLTQSNRSQGQQAGV